MNTTVPEWALFQRLRAEGKEPAQIARRLKAAGGFVVSGKSRTLFVREAVERRIGTFDPTDHKRALSALKRLADMRRLSGRRSEADWLMGTARFVTVDGFVVAYLARTNPVIVFFLDRKATGEGQMLAHKVGERGVELHSSDEASLLARQVGHAFAEAACEAVARAEMNAVSPAGLSDVDAPTYRSAPTTKARPRGSRARKKRA